MVKHDSKWQIHGLPCTYLYRTCLTIMFFSICIDMTNIIFYNVKKISAYRTLVKHDLSMYMVYLGESCFTRSDHGVTTLVSFLMGIWCHQTIMLKFWNILFKLSIETKFLLCKSIVWFLHLKIVYCNISSGCEWVFT